MIMLTWLRHSQMPLVWKFMHSDFLKKKVSSGKEMIDFDFFRKGDEAWPNAPSLENECIILKKFWFG